LFTDGITNKLIGCYVGDAMEDVVLVRIYGNKTELLVDRDEEVKSFRVLQAHGCAPQLYCTFNNGLCYEFIQGEALDPQHVCKPAIF
ncbi:ethanolamine kinase 1-like, partial [Nannospalax galili]